ncbi:MAG: nickel pincer cofactor biosynthesis protein LarB [bacterium]|nr:nickel pincer cofactor biosynthesis protein LarB [bacterium]
MDSKRLQALLEEVAAGTTHVSDALDALADASGVDDLGFAKLDTDRERRTGMAEVIFAAGKTDDQLRRLVARCLERHGSVLATRVEAPRTPRLLEEFPQLRFNEPGRVLYCRPTPSTTHSDTRIAVVCAGTADLPVAEESACVLEFLGHDVERVSDVGVAGIHRLVSELDRLREARVVIVAAGMEGALPSVVAGLVAAPVIAIPTSVGYGASFGGVAALLAMLNSCATGIGVVNIDNGFGAATLAHRIVTRHNESES